MSNRAESFLVGLVGDGVMPSLTPYMHEREGDVQGLRYLYRPIDLTATRRGGQPSHSPIQNRTLRENHKEPHFPLPIAVFAHSAPNFNTPVFRVFDTVFTRKLPVSTSFAPSPSASALFSASRRLCGDSPLLRVSLPFVQIRVHSWATSACARDMRADKKMDLTQ